ncbi:hypothetical protein Taro_010381 [Colocasia esculenta]|uniref:CCHC-type domain-containing protein n=1 Tax=Colocasia esculenta TaxID=4460 RepID=A0A843U9D5_COLES|nr:hypothetical protein [Colocasia esculenta]
MWTPTSLTCMRCRAQNSGSKLAHRLGSYRQQSEWGSHQHFGTGEVSLLYLNPKCFPNPSLCLFAREEEEENPRAMASRGRRGGAPAREDEPRGDELAEQQAPAPQGPVLPPPPPMDYGVFMQGLVQAMQTKAHTKAALQAQLDAQPSLRTRLVAFGHRTLDEALSAACRQEEEMEQHLEEKKASQKRPAATFQRQDKKKAVYPTQQRPVAVGSTQVPSVRSPGVKKECPHCGKTHGGSECLMIMGKCLKCGSSDHKIKDCPRLQQGVQCGVPAPAAVAAAKRRDQKKRLLQMRMLDEPQQKEDEEEEEMWR